MRKVLIRPRADADLEGIWLYTLETWSEEQASRCLRQLDEAIQLLATDPRRGKDRREIAPGYFSIHVGRHVVFYTFTDEMAGVERMLHDQMDIPRHF
ncbi:MAG: type II toxin-antitoxin system RelE/ParE family toxin [Planctomycetota bacterium]